MYEGNKINSNNLINYIRDNYGTNYNLIEAKSLPNIKPFLQNNYGGDADCTLVSIMTCVHFLLYKIGVNSLYKTIEEKAKRYGYKIDKGFFPLFNKALYKNVLYNYGITKKITAKYFKDFGFIFEDIIEIINKNTPIILSLWSDGRKYYRSHSVSIIGYKYYQDNKDNEIKLLEIYDNWTNEKTYIDYKLLNKISCIVY